MKDKDPVWDSLIRPNNARTVSGESETDRPNFFINIEPSTPVHINNNTEENEHPGGGGNPATPSEIGSSGSESSSNILRLPSFMSNSSNSDGYAMKKNKKTHAHRLVRKSGGVNVKVVNVEDKGERYVGDFFTTLVDVRWRWTLTYFTISYVLSWFLFAVIWWLLLVLHDDPDHFEEKGWKPCVVGVKSFASIFLFSLETQHTIGYGYHRMSDECTSAIILLVVQSIIGVIIESLTVGVFIVKLSRSKKRAQTVVFSKHAVICKKDDALTFSFRVADVGKSNLLEAHIRAQLITKTVGKSGKVLLCQQSITLEADDKDEDRLLLFWPTTVHHEIDEESPLYAMSSGNFKKSCDKQFEIVVVLEGIVESTGMTTQARTSYLPSEILWGHHFLELLHEGGKYTADMELFHTTFPHTSTGPQSAKELKETQETESETSVPHG